MWFSWLIFFLTIYQLNQNLASNRLWHLCIFLFVLLEINYKLNVNKLVKSKIIKKFILFNKKKSSANYLKAWIGKFCKGLKL